MTTTEPQQHQHGHHHETVMRIHVNGKEHESPTPILADALYALASVPACEQLYREVQGDEEDEAILHGHEEVHLYKDEHFYSRPEAFKGYTIIVNGTAKTVHQGTLTFEELVKLAYPVPPAGQIVYTVTYRGGRKSQPDGTLTEGEKVKIKNKMIFNVTATDKS
jgi:hypothetical protein